MKITEYIGSQFGNPRGVVGRICCIIMNVINKSMYNEVVNVVDLNESSRMLDIGYGNGYLIKKVYKNKRCYIEGIDISQDMKDKASKVNGKGIAEGKINLGIGDCCNMQWEDLRFDTITSVNTIYFWANTEKGLSEIYRTLKSGGIFVNAVYSKEWLEQLAYTKKGFKFFEPIQIKELAKAAGFNEIEIKLLSNKKSYVIICYK